ncbi:hypothetical protein M413DRAFT_66110, partial [Hebeloma cylindrosporum]
LRDLILHLIADAPPPNWLRIENANQVQKVVALLVPGLMPDLLSLPPLPTSATANPNLPISIPLLAPSTAPTSTSTASQSLASKIPFIATTFSHACPTRAPGDQTRMQVCLARSSLGRSVGRRRRGAETNKTDPTQYLLTLEQMIENDYPIPSYMADVFEKPPGWVEMPQPKEDEGKWGQRIYAIDCEMCITEDGKELTRVCLIDFTSGIVVYDQLVKPTKPILDYLTRWSGITAEALAPITTTLAQVQVQIMRILSPPQPNPFTTAKSQSQSSPQPTPILLGHSLESDLKALKLCHPRCIDTALLYHHPRGRPLKPGLAWLTKKWCGREIQTKGEGGHDPEEDARACVDLLKRKMEGGPGFGEFRVDYESIFERMGRSGGGGGGGGGGKAAGGVKSAVVDHGSPGVMHGAKASTAVGCKTDEEVMEGVLDVLPAHQFVFGRFMGLANALGWVTPKDQAPTPAELSPVLTALNTQLKTIHAALPPRTALVIFTGHSDPRTMSLLNVRKNAYESALKSGRTPEEIGAGAGGGGGVDGKNGTGGLRWSAGDARDLEEAVELARRGLVFLGVKQ